jgi:cytochrome b561
MTMVGTTAEEAQGAAGYGSVAKWFHWITVVLLAVALPVGFVIKYITPEDGFAHKMLFYAIHESAGLTIFVVALARLAWRLTHRPPPHPSDLPPLMRKAADGVHHALYAMLILQPLLGFFMTNAFGFPMQGATAYLGLIDLPKFMEARKGLAEALKLLHMIGGYTILVLLVLHIGGAVFHQAIRRDGTLLRMV